MRTFCAAIALVTLCSTLSVAEPDSAPHGGLMPGLSGHPPPPTAPGADPQSMVSGKVIETMDAGGYTYVKVATGDGEVWAAGPQTSLKVGETISFPRGMEMRNFRSDKLDRTFERIAFVNSITVGAPGAATAAAAPAPGKTDPHGTIPAGGATGVDLSGIERAEGGKTVAEILEQKDALAGKEVVLRAKVVKVNRGIMSRNWLHLRDGTKSSSGADDLTITSSDAAEVGTKVLVRGKVAVNKDFGFGYRYDVLVEDATITPE